jgi:thiol-disulfide isomerase/thioredoxin
VGAPAPALDLPDVEGRRIRLSDLRGAPTLVLFWNPGCGFCERMLPDLKAWETAPPPGAPRLLVVSAGSAEANRAMGLRAPVVLDEAFAAGHRFGVGGTPSAVLVDADGRIAAPAAVGAAAVLALARTPVASVREVKEPARKAEVNGRYARR